VWVVIPDLLLLAAVVAVSFGVEAATGFGSTVIALALGGRWFGVERLLAVLVPLNMVLSAVIVWRDWPSVSRPFLLQRAFPAMAVGLIAGVLLSTWLGSDVLLAAFGAFILVLAVWQLATARRPPPALGERAQWAALVAGGFIHGLFATGGPLAVLVAQRQLPDKREMRATLAALWLTMNTVWLVRTADTKALATSGALLVPLALGALLGNRLHHALQGAAFRVAVAALLLVGGASIVLGTLR
jgi:uncharacterized membrane protein YfcA